MVASTSPAIEAGIARNLVAFMRIPPVLELALPPSGTPLLKAILCRNFHRVNEGEMSYG
jgi:hypothetical protein